MEALVRHYRSREAWRISFGDGASVERIEHAPADAPVIAPGLVDLQVNGFAGVDLNSPGVDADALRAVCRAVARHGVTRFMPTVISASVDDMRARLAAIAAARARDPVAASATALGIHLEGPFISAADGARGAHDARWVIAPDAALFDRLQEAADGAIRMVTLAPELDGAIELTRRLADAGVTVAIGHTTAEVEQIATAVRAGARLSTHLGNGVPQLVARHANAINAQLAEDELAATFIADGHHVPPYVLKSYVRAKGLERSILVTDATAAAGAPPGTYHLGALELEVGDDRIVRHPGRRSFAGSALTLDRAVGNAWRWCGIDPADAIDMASLNVDRALRGRPAGAWDVAAGGPGRELIVANVTGGSLEVRFAVRDGVRLG